MELQQLRYFVAVARTGNFTRAAAACHVTQPSLSQQIRKLEEEFEQPLLTRRMSREETTLTPAGEVLLEHAVKVLGEVEATYRAMSQRDGSSSGVARSD